MPGNLGEIDQLKIALDGLRMMTTLIKQLSTITKIPIHSVDDLFYAMSEGEIMLINLQKTFKDIQPKQNP